MKQLGDVTHKNLWGIGSIVATGWEHFNQIHQVASQAFGITNRTTVSRCLKALVSKGFVEKYVGENGGRTVYHPIGSKLRDRLQEECLSLQLRQDEIRRRTSRIRDELTGRVVRVPRVYTKSLSPGWLSYLERRAELTKEEIKDTKIKQLRMTGSQWNTYLWINEPSLYKRLESAFRYWERRTKSKGETVQT